MRKFDEQFMTRFMLPLVQEVVTDMGKGEKNPYLGKLINGEQLEPMEKNDFILDYFETRQDQERKKPFAEMGDDESRVFWNKFLDGFSKYMVLRYRLSGQSGAQAAFCPDKEGKFTQEATRNMFELAYRMTLDFENERLTKLTAGEAEKEHAGEAGAQAPAGGLPPAGQGIAAEADVTEQAPAGAVLFGDATGAAAAATDKKYEDIVTKLGDSGLKIEPNTFKNEAGQWEFDPDPNKAGWLTGKVKDRDGNVLKVNVNPDAAAGDRNKYEFAFQDNAVSPDGKSLADYPPFSVSENDLKNFKEKSAFDVAQGAAPKTVKEKYAPPALEKPGTGVPEGFVLPGVTQRPDIHGKLPKGSSMDLEKKEHILPGIGISRDEGKVPTIPKHAKALSLTRRVNVKGLPAVKRQPLTTIRGKKESVAAKRKMPPRAGGQQPAAAQGGVSAPAETAAAKPPQKKKSLWKKVALAYGVSFGGFGALGGMAAISGQSAANPDDVAKAIYMVLHSLGVSFFS